MLYRCKLTLVLVLLVQFGAIGQTLNGFEAVQTNTSASPCISQSAYDLMEAEIKQNSERLGWQHHTENAPLTTLLDWPLKPAAQFRDCQHFFISAFVDLDSTNGVADWNCGTRTYNGHRGIDIVPWPYIWDKMDNELIQVVAAAGGILVGKKDGNPDRVCNGTGGGSNSNNYIAIQHPDGSRTLYVHMKSGSLTTKTIGQSVEAGEYLGIIGSAGQSTGVHLHFEVRSDGTFEHYIDPHFGACNSAVAASWWAVQPAYISPELLKVSVHSSWPYAAVCPNTVDTLYEQDTFLSIAGAQAVFSAYTKHVAAGDTWSFRILNPDSTVFDSWTYTSLSNRTTSSLGWWRQLPVQAGTYVYEATFNAATCSKPFTIKSTTATQTGEEDESPGVVLFPNPAADWIGIKLSKAALHQGAVMCSIFNAAGQLVWQLPIKEPESRFPLQLPEGIYFFKVLGESGDAVSGKFWIRF